jgi:hypothetical protein
MLATYFCILIGLELAVHLPGEVSAQEINFDQIDRFESLGTGTLRVGSAPKTIIDDGERHVVILTIWDADAETKVYWRSPSSRLGGYPLHPFTETDLWRSCTFRLIRSTRHPCRL